MGAAARMRGTVSIKNPVCAMVRSVEMFKGANLPDVFQTCQGFGANGAPYVQRATHPRASGFDPKSPKGSPETFATPLRNAKPIQDGRARFGNAISVPKCALRFEMPASIRQAKHISKWNLCFRGIPDASPIPKRISESKMVFHFEIPFLILNGPSLTRPLAVHPLSKCLHLSGERPELATIEVENPAISPHLGPIFSPIATAVLSHPS